MSRSALSNSRGPSSSGSRRLKTRRNRQNLARSVASLSAGMANAAISGGSRRRRQRTALTRNPPKTRNALTFGAGNRKRIILSETEYIGEVTVANEPNFNQNLASGYPINPGQSATFPWLSTIAARYEKYRFLKLMFIYKPEVTEFTANVNTGKVILECDYDASDAAPVTKQQMLDTLPHNDGMPYEYIELVLDPTELSSKSDAKYVRPGGLPGSSDIKTYDGGNVFVATQGQTANSVIGELHVQYTIELSIPVLENLVGAPINNQVSEFAQSTGTVGATTVAYTPPLATVVTNGPGMTNVAGVITPPVGNYLVDFQIGITDTTTNINALTVALVKNAGALITITSPVQPNANLANASGSYFISCNGTDTINLSVVATYAAPTVTTSGYIRFVLI